MANPIILIAAAGAALLLLSGKKKGKTSSKNGEKSKSACVSEFDFDKSKIAYDSLFTAGVSSEVPSDVVDRIRNGDRDFIGMMTRVLSQQIPSHCLTNPDTIVHDLESGDKVPAPAALYLLALQAVGASEFHDLIDYDEEKQAKSELIAWWDKHMPGQPLPQD